MSPERLRELLQEVPDTREIVIRPHARGDVGDELVAAWRIAHEEATRALDAWRARPGRRAWAVFRAAADRADAAQDALAAR